MTRGADGPIAECVALFREGHLDALVYRVWSLPAPDLPDLLVPLGPAERDRLLLLLPPRLTARLLVELPPDAASGALLEALPPERAADVAGALDEDQATALLAGLPAARREAILTAMRERAPIDRLLRHRAGTAGRLMTTLVIVVTESDSIALALESVRRQAREIGDAAGICVTDVARRLTGLLSYRQLVLAPPGAQVRDVMRPARHRIGPDEPADAVTRMLRRYHLQALPVVDDAGRLMGCVTAGDSAHLAVVEARTTFLHFAGVVGDEEFHGGWGAAVRSRLPTLYTNLLTAGMAAGLMHLVAGRPGQLTPLLVWVPIVAGMGGNAGIQALASAQYRLAQRRLPWTRRRVVLTKELAVGLVNGALIGAMVAGTVLLVGAPARTGLVVFLALLLHLPLAGALAVIAPMVLRRVGFDPGLASAPTVATVLDALGMALLFALGLVLL